MFPDADEQWELYITSGSWAGDKELWVPPEVKEAAGHRRVILFLFLKLPIAFQAALTTLVQVRGYIDA